MPFLPRYHAPLPHNGRNELLDFIYIFGLLSLISEQFQLALTEVVSMEALQLFLTLNSSVGFDRFGTQSISSFGAKSLSGSDSKIGVRSDAVFTLVPKNHMIRFFWRSRVLLGDSPGYLFAVHLPTLHAVYLMSGEEQHECTGRWSISLTCKIACSNDINKLRASSTHKYDIPDVYR